MKAILVIDIPETIKTEYLNKKITVQLWNKKNYIMHDMCVLKPMPNELDEIKVLKNHDERIYRVGFNDALRIIKGDGITCKIG